MSIIENRIDELEKAIQHHRQHKEYYAKLFDRCDIDRVKLEIDYTVRGISYTGFSEIDVDVNPFLETLTKGYIQHLHEWHHSKVLLYDHELTKLKAQIRGRVENCKTVKS